MPSKNGHATITDVARVAGVSVSTVSRFINGKGDVSPQAQHAIRGALASTSYTASPVARSLVGARTRLLGLHAQRLTDEYASALIHGVVERAEEAGYGLLLFAASSGAQNPAAPLLRTLPDGLLVVSPTVDDDPVPESGGDRPVVFIEQRDDGDTGAVVTATNHEGEIALTRHVLALGHRRIGFVAGSPALSSSRERLAGFRAALTEAGVALAAEMIVPGRNDRDSGLDAGRVLLRRADRPTAIIATNDLEAVGVLSAAREAGLRVPDDLSVAGFDDLPLAAHAHPPLTTVHQPLAEMGRRAVEMLIRWIEGTAPDPRRVVLPTRLVIRESCAPPPATLGNGR